MLRPSSLAIVLAILMLSGCSYIGPQSLRATRVDYNQAIQQTNDQELLLNLVRLRYYDNLYFLNVERIASTVELNRSLAVSADFPESGNAILKLGAASVGFNEKPSIFYVPLEGEKFVRQMMAPYNLNLVVLMTNSGWSIDRVFSIMLREINGIKNAPSASGPTPKLAPEYETYYQVIHLLRELQKLDGLDLGKIPDNESTLELRFAPSVAKRPEAVRLRQLLGLNPDLDEYSLKVGIGRIDDATITIFPRSMVSTLSFLAQSVMVPEADADAGLVTTTRDSNGAAFDWGKIFDPLIRVRTAEARPLFGHATVNYRGRWFYIDDRDLTAKSTFSLLSQLFALQAGTASGSSLNLSFPIGR